MLTERNRRNTWLCRGGFLWRFGTRSATTVTSEVACRRNWRHPSGMGALILRACRAQQASGSLSGSFSRTSIPYLPEGSAGESAWFLGTPDHRSLTDGRFAIRTTFATCDAVGASVVTGASATVWQETCSLDGQIIRDSPQRQRAWQCGWWFDHGQLFETRLGTTRRFCSGAKVLAFASGRQSIA